MHALHNVAVLFGFCKILNIVKLHIVKTTITILSQTIYIAHPYLHVVALLLVLIASIMSSLFKSLND